MKKKVMSVLLSTAMAAALMSGCGSSAGKESSTAGEEKRRVPGAVRRSP